MLSNQWINKSFQCNSLCLPKFCFFEVFLLTCLSLKGFWGRKNTVNTETYQTNRAVLSVSLQLLAFTINFLDRPNQLELWVEFNKFMLRLLFLYSMRQGKSGLCTCQHLKLSLWACVLLFQVITLKRLLCQAEVHPTVSLYPTVTRQPHQQSRWYKPGLYQLLNDSKGRKTWDMLGIFYNISWKYFDLFEKNVTFCQTKQKFI